MNIKKTCNNSNNSSFRGQAWVSADVSRCQQVLGVVRTSEMLVWVLWADRDSVMYVIMGVRECDVKSVMPRGESRRHKVSNDGVHDEAEIAEEKMSMREKEREKKKRE